MSAIVIAMPSRARRPNHLRQSERPHCPRPAIPCLTSRLVSDPYELPQRVCSLVDDRSAPHSVSENLSQSGRSPGLSHSAPTGPGIEWFTDLMPLWLRPGYQSRKNDSHSLAQGPPRNRPPARPGPGPENAGRARSPASCSSPTAGPVPPPLPPALARPSNPAKPALPKPKFFPN